MKLEGKVILVTGASSGIGKSIAERFAEENCRLVLTARRLELLEDLKRKLGTDNVKIIQCDVRIKTEVEKAYKTIIENFGHVDIAVLNAGVGHAITPETYNSKFAEDIFGVNVLGMIYWIEQLLPDFLIRKNGVIAGVSSLSDNRGYSGSGFYCASKAAATIYFEGLRVELKKHGIKVITIKPGFVKTPMTDKNNFDMPFIMPAEKASDIIVKGIIKEKRIIQFPWQTILLTRLIGAIPGSIYEWLAAKVKV